MADIDTIARVVVLMAVAFVAGTVFGARLVVHFYRRARAARLAELG